MPRFRSFPPADTLLENRIAKAFGFLPSKVARFLAVESAIVGAALMAPFAIRPTHSGVTFPYAQGSGLRLAAWGAPIYFLFEIFVLSQWVGGHQPWLRIGHRALAVYATLWLWGAYALARARPHRLDGDQLTVHRGIWGRLQISLADVVSVRRRPDADPFHPATRDPDTVWLALRSTDLVEITVRAPVVAMGYLGPKRPGTKVVVSVDDPERICQELQRLAMTRALFPQVSPTL